MANTQVSLYFFSLQVGRICYAFLYEVNVVLPVDSF